MAQFEPDDFKRMADAMSSCIIVHDAATKAILWANPAACAVLGFTLDELLPLKAPDMSGRAAQYGRDVGLRWLQGAVERGINVIEWCYRAKNGEEIMSEAIATLVHLARGDVVMVQFRDIAREEQARREMKRLESRLTEFMQDSDEGVAVLGADSRFDYLSTTGRKLLGLAPATGATLPHLATLCTPETRRELAQIQALALPHGPALQFVFETEQATGARRWFQASCRHIDIEGDLRGHLLHFRDITAQVEADQARRDQQAALEYLARHNAMGEMAGAIAHELSQPLAAIRNYLQGSLLRLRSSEATREGIGAGLEAAARQVDHASAIIKSVRDYVVKLEQTEAPADLNGILADTRYFIELKAEEAGVRLAFSFAPDPLMVSCEKVLIGQVVLNLAFNAIEEMQRLPEPRRLVRIGTARDGDKAYVSVQDQGNGIDAALHERLFDGFFTSKVSGNGIGLALCKNIIGRHRGDIWAEAAPGGGALFQFSLPLLPGQELRP
ncbi:ATP-binding protein [Massilia cellulosiltytica]|uniref:ATP-binding protein n=1 Tax=Massilia cellulosiltytica TaxID=2683234 RepID=UPI0039B6DAFF